MVAVHTLAAPAEPSERRIPVAGTEVRLIEAGAGDPVLLLHGFGDSVNTWQRVLPALSRRFRVLAVDLPGFGESGPPPDGPLIDQLTRVVDGVVRRTCRRVPVAIVGNSMGGAVAVRYALWRPQRVSRLVLIGCAGLAPGVPLWWRLVLGQLLPLRALAGRTLGVVPAGLIQGVAARVYARLVLADPGAGHAATVDGFSRFYRRASDVERLLRLGSLLVDDLADGRLATDVLQLETPTLLVWGRHDRLVPLTQATRLASAVPRMRLRIIEHCGHCPQVERPHEFVAAIEPFLRRRAAAGTGPVVVPAERPTG